MTLDQYILAGAGFVVLTFLLFPLLKYLTSKAQMKGWLDVLKQNNKEEPKHVRPKK